MIRRVHRLVGIRPPNQTDDPFCESSSPGQFSQASAVTCHLHISSLSCIVRVVVTVQVLPILWTTIHADAYRLWMTEL